MHKDLKLILSAFTRQQTAEGCGAACLETLFKYSGMPVNLPASAHNQALSLKQLQEFANAGGLQARAVRMDLEHLRRSKTPCILHVLNDSFTFHFIVCYGYDPKLQLYLVSDPDGQVGYTTEHDLLLRWQSSAGLYFEQLPKIAGWRVRLYPWGYLTHFRFVPGILWIAIPMLNTFASTIGLGATLIIEKAVNPGFVDSGWHLMTLIFGLLLFLSLAKGGIGFIKERLMVNFSGKLDNVLFLQWTAPFQRSVCGTNFLKRHYAEAIKDVQRVHQSVSVLIGGLLSDALMLAILLTCLYFYFPLMVLAELTVITLFILLTNRQLPFMMINYRSGLLNPITVSRKPAESEEAELAALAGWGIETNSAFSRKAVTLSSHASKLNFWFDCLSSINILAAIAHMLYQLRLNTASYREFIFGIILCYSVTGLATKICNQLFLVAQGAEMLAQREEKI